jgi:O-acetyl-ADP-ribose deacetylase (regulator of RNase III)
MRIEIYRDSVVFQDVDAIVNAANVTLLGGGGVDGAIHAAAGPKLYWYFHDLGCTCQPGEAIESPGFDLPAKHIIHTVGPIWHEGEFNEPEILADCYRNCLIEATECHCRSIAFCCISVGIYRCPLKPATRIAIATVSGWLKKHESDMLVRFCCYSDREFETYMAVADELGIPYATNCDE